MLGPMEYQTISIRLSVDYNRSITHTNVHNQIILYVKYNSHTFSDQFG